MLDCVSFVNKMDDSNKHMLIQSEVVDQLWRRIENWIVEIGVQEYTIGEDIVIVVELNNTYWINLIVLVGEESYIQCYD